MTSKLKSLLFGGGIGLATCVPGALAQEVQPTARQIDEIVITARRREELAQEVPVSATILDGEALQRFTIQSLQDVQTLSPGLRIGAEGTKSQMVISLRGLYRAVAGGGVPAVVSYFAEVPMAAEASNIPTYDLSSIQVLKGPQGTLFGRNTIGGALLISPQQPDYVLNGYLRTGFGNYNQQLYEGAVNTPIIADKIALRIAAQLRRRDGYTRNLGNGSDLEDVHADSFRASLRVDPFDGLSNITVFDWTETDENGPANILIGADPRFLASRLPPPIANAINGSIASQLALQNQRGPHKTATVITPFAESTLYGITNTTELALDRFTVRNIFGYRHVESADRTNTDGLSEMIGFAPILGPTTVITGARVIDRSALSNEFQLLGDAFDDKLSWITGVFYAEDEPDGISGTNLRFFGTGAYQSSYRRVESLGVFAQIGWDMSHLVEGLTLNLGARHNRDETTACATIEPLTYASESHCKANAALNMVDSSGIIDNDSSANTWTIGLDYKINEDAFIYITSRRSYREGGVNTPLFSDTDTTGVGGAQTNTSLYLAPYQTYDPEYVTDIEVGLKSDWQLNDWTGRFNMAAFRTRYEDIQNTITIAPALYNPVTNPGGVIDPLDAPQDSSITFNGGQLTLEGIDLEAALSPTDNLTFILTANYVNQIIDKRASLNPVLNPGFASIIFPSPQVSWSLAFNYLLPISPLGGDLELSGNYYWSDEREIGAQLIDSYGVAGFRLDWRNIAGSNFEAGVFVRNAFDEEHVHGGALTGAGLPVNTVFFGEPRMYGLEATWRFGAR